MNAELRARILAFNRERVADKTTRSDLETRVNTLLADLAVRNAENTRLLGEVSSATERMRSIANAFSNTTWVLLPSGIKKYFEEYRE